jgi:hypothetical protein
MSTKVRQRSPRKSVRLAVKTTQKQKAARRRPTRRRHNHQSGIVEKQKGRRRERARFNALVDAFPDSATGFRDLAGLLLLAATNLSVDAVVTAAITTAADGHVIVSGILPDGSQWQLKQEFPELVELAAIAASKEGRPLDGRLIGGGPDAFESRLLGYASAARLARATPNSLRNLVRRVTKAKAARMPKRMPARDASASFGPSALPKAVAAVLAGLFIGGSTIEVAATTTLSSQQNAPVGAQELNDSTRQAAHVSRTRVASPRLTHSGRGAGSAPAVRSQKEPTTHDHAKVQSEKERESTRKETTQRAVNDQRVREYDKPMTGADPVGNALIGGIVGAAVKGGSLIVGGITGAAKGVALGTGKEALKAAQEKAAREKAAQEKAAQEKAAREKAAREKAAQEKAAREKATQEKAERDRKAIERATEPHSSGRDGDRGRRDFNDADRGAIGRAGTKA